MKNLLDDLHAERAKYGTVLTDDECVELLNAVAWQNRDDGWALSRKDFGAGVGRRYDGALCSHDTLIHRPSNHIFDVLERAGAESRPRWHDYGVNTQPHRGPIDPIPPREVGPKIEIRTKLGATLFALVDLYQHERARCDDTIRRLRDEMAVRFLRVFWRKGTGDRGDYWTNEPYYSLVRTDLSQLPVSLMREVMQYVRDEGLTIAHCVFADSLRRGGGYLSLPELDTFTDGFLEAACAVPDAIEYVEVFNEPYTRGLITGERGHGGDIPMLQHIARRLRAGLGPNVLIALGTPQSVHMGQDNRLEAEVRDMHAACPEANLITVHLSRRYPDGRVNNNPQRTPDLSAFAPRRRSNGEPIGPDSSVAETKDAAALAENFRETQRCGYEWYVFHADPLIRPRGRNVWDYAEWPAIAAALRDVSGAHVRPPVIPQPMRERATLGPGDELKPGERLRSRNGLFTLEYQGDGNLVIYDWRHDPPQAVWSTDTHVDGYPPLAVAMQRDGNLVVYARNEDGSGRAVWATPTRGQNVILELQNHGNAVLYDNGQALWSTPVIWPDEGEANVRAEDREPEK